MIGALLVALAVIAVVAMPAVGAYRVYCDGVLAGSRGAALAACPYDYDEFVALWTLGYAAGSQARYLAELVQGKREEKR